MQMRKLSLVVSRVVVIVVYWILLSYRHVPFRHLHGRQNPMGGHIDEVIGRKRMCGESTYGLQFDFDTLLIALVRS